MLEVVCGIIYKDDKVFLARRKKGKDLEGYWEFPGGKIEQHESPKIALERELKEELGMTVYVGKYLGENVYKYPTKTIKLIAYNCIFIEASFKLTDHDKYNWVTTDELKNYTLAQADIPLVNLIEQ